MRIIPIPDIAFYEFNNKSVKPIELLMFESKFKEERVNDPGLIEHSGLECSNRFQIMRFHGLYRNDVFRLVDNKTIIFGVQIIVSERFQFANVFYTYVEDKKGGQEKHIMQPLYYIPADAIDCKSVYIPIRELRKKWGQNDLVLSEGTYFQTTLNAFTKAEYKFCLSEKLHQKLKKDYKICLQ